MKIEYNQSDKILTIIFIIYIILNQNKIQNFSKLIKINSDTKFFQIKSSFTKILNMG